MDEKQFHPGEVIFNEGDASEYVVQILSGSVEIVKKVDGKMIVLGVAKKGEFVGEMGIFEDTPRNATARAKDDLSVLLVGEKEFMKMVGETPRLAKHLLNRLSARLRVTSKELAEARIIKGEVKAKRFLDFCNLDSGNEIRTDNAKLVLSPNNRVLAEQIPEVGITINKFPFIIGRKSDDFSESNPGSIIVHLQLNDFAPYRLSRVHFMVQRAKDVFVLRDLGSALGTGVNGQFLGVDFPRDSIKLEAGDNTVVAGGTESPFSFNLSVPKM